jgi:hypothetical protein
MKPARLIARGGLQQARQQRGAHMAHLAADRVFQRVASSPPAKERGEAWSMKL